MSRSEHLSSKASIFWHARSGVRFVTVIGVVDVSNAEALAAALNAPKLNIDMSRLESIDNEGLTTLLLARLCASRVKLRVSRNVRERLDQSGILPMFESSDGDTSNDQPW
jgi:anti-anti-sigma regulatory factor